MHGPLRAQSNHLRLGLDQIIAWKAEDGPTPKVALVGVPRDFLSVCLFFLFMNSRATCSDYASACSGEDIAAINTLCEGMDG